MTFTVFLLGTFLTITAVTCHTSCSDTPGITYTAHPYDCAYFYECYNGAITLLRCPDGFLWDNKRSMCEVASQVDCSYTSERPETTEPEDESKPTTQGVETTTKENMCMGQPEGTIFPDLDDCSKFVICDQEEERVMYCGTGTIWDQDELQCVIGSC